MRVTLEPLTRFARKLIEQNGPHWRATVIEDGFVVELRPLESEEPLVKVGLEGKPLFRFASTYTGR